MTKPTSQQEGVTARMETESRLLAALLRHGQADLAKALDISEAEVSRKINGESGWKIEQFAKALDFVGAKIVNDEYTIIPKDVLAALQVLARNSKSLEAQ